MGITLDADWIADISPYSVGDTGSETITTAQLSRYLGVVESRAEEDNATDYMMALLVCDLIERKNGNLNIKSEKIGSDYSIQYDNAEKTQYMGLYEQELARHEQGLVASDGIDRADSVLEFSKLDQVRLPDTNQDDDFSTW
jgi:hypothetical protein